MSHDNQNGKKFAVGALLAGLFGYLAGILTAPKSGRQTRQDIQNKAVQTRREAEQQLKKIHSELDKLISHGKDQADDLGKQAGKEWDKAVAAATVAKDKVREVLSAIHEGETDDEDLDKAIKDATDAVGHLRDYLSRVKDKK